MIDDLIEVLRICQEGKMRVALTEVARCQDRRGPGRTPSFAAAARRPLVVSWPAAGQVGAAIRATQHRPAHRPAGSQRRHRGSPHPCAMGRRRRLRRAGWDGPPPVDPARAAALLSAVAAAVAARRPRAGRLRGRAGVARHRGGAARSQPLHGGCAPRGRAGGGRTFIRCWCRPRAVPARSWWPARSTVRARGARECPCALNCAALPDDLMKPSSSATRGERSRAPSERRVCSKRQMGRCSSSTRWASCRRAVRPSCCGSFRRARSDGSGKPPPGASTCASSRQPTACSIRKSKPAASGVICGIAST